MIPVRKNLIVNGLNVVYLQSEAIDKSNALVFLHGWGSEADHFAKTLIKCPSFVALDLPGFGGSEMPNTAWSLADYANFVKDFVDKVGISNPLVAGHSFGGSVAIKYCAQGNSVKQLILIGSAGIRRKTAKKFGLLAVAKIFGLIFSLPGIRAVKNGVRKRFYKKIDSDDYLKAGAMIGTYKKIISENLEEDLQKITVPTVLIWGINDKDTPLEDGRLMQSLVSGSELCVVSDAGHYVFLDNVKAFEEIFLPLVK